MIFVKFSEKKRITSVVSDYHLLCLALMKNNNERFHSGKSLHCSVAISIQLKTTNGNVWKIQLTL